MANMRAFQACDESSILSARTNKTSHLMCGFLLAYDTIKKMIKAVVIDIDDTLCLTETASFEIENTALELMGLPPMSRQIHIDTWGQPMPKVINVRSPGIDADRFMPIYLPTIQEFVASGRLDAIPAENYETLDKLIEMDKDIMILTSRTYVELKHLLEPDHLLTNRLKAFYHKDNIEFCKPDPRAFDKLLSDHDLEPTDCVYIGDSISDAKSATTAGLHFIASLESGLRTKSDFKDFQVDAFVDKFTDIITAISKIK